ncbi:MAG: ABC transporter ATP-binding protein [Candidatus ainarchaeum sp.]|nr:ABC transporter ATP-binding protein [Candidatus ainarchaeum sp.]MDD5096674.1 ABC transporter ATP-binding protein [Candidatus ainarchaeum sp.]
MLEVGGLSVSSKGRRLLGGVSFSIKKGECLGVVGTMGSGKTTLLYAIKGIIPGLKPGKVGGTIRFMGGERLPMDKRIGIVFQNPNDQVFCSTLAEEVGFGLKNLGVRGQELEARVAGALGRVGLEERATDDPFELSQGQRQKLAIASVLAMEPELLLLDEPTSSLDHRASLEIYDILKGLSLEGKSMIVVEHQTEYLARLAGEYLVLNEGKQVAYGGKKIFKSGKAAEWGVKVPCSR